MNTSPEILYKSPLIIGCDHAAYPLKEKIKQYLKTLDIKTEDVGAFSEESVNYTDFGIRVASAVSTGIFERGILLCGTGLGMSMLANKFPRVRAALVSEGFSAKMSRLHNDSNILVMGGRTTGEALAIDLVKIWLETPFEGGRHLERINVFDTILQKGTN
jgi:ribose 5-phosphate isomerase B